MYMYVRIHAFEARGFIVYRPFRYYVIANGSVVVCISCVYICTRTDTVLFLQEGYTLMPRTIAV